jgi:hypothetical protein
MRSTIRSGILVFCSLSVLSPATPTLADTQPVRLCRSYVQGRIDVLDAELHKGRKPNEARKLVKRRDRLKDQLAACERNPAAYKKEL